MGQLTKAFDINLIRLHGAVSLRAVPEHPVDQVLQASGPLFDGGELIGEL